MLFESEYAEMSVDGGQQVASLSVDRYQWLPHYPIGHIVKLMVWTMKTAIICLDITFLRRSTSLQ